MTRLIITGIVSIALFVGCGGQDSTGQEQVQSEEDTESGLTEFELENGIGPVTEAVKIGEIDAELAEKGAQIFEMKCSACHKMGERYVGPALGDVLDSRTPAYVMNMVLNPDEMVKKHPEAKEKMAEFMTPMPNQNLKMEEARAIVEYLASTNQQEETN